MKNIETLADLVREQQARDYAARYEPPVKDVVNHPPHYNKGKVECIDAIESAVSDLHGIEAVCTANAIKYLYRWKAKDGLESLKKARWYLDKLIDILEEQK